MNISDDHKAYIDKKVDRLRRMCAKIDEMRITLTKEKLRFEAECNFRAGRIAVQATVTGAAPTEAIDLLVDKVEARVRKAKTKLVDKKEASRQKARINGQLMAQELTTSPEEEDLLEAEGA
jgi:ribosomal subunit interface protein